MDEETQKEIENIHQAKVDGRRKVYRESSMTIYRTEIEYLRFCGASYMEIQHWLRRYHHINIRERTSIGKRLKIWANDPNVPTLLDKNLQVKLKQQLIMIQKLVRKNRRTRKNRIDCHKEAILQMVNDGYSLGDIQLWLRRVRRMRVARSTIHTKIKKWKSLSNH